MKLCAISDQHGWLPDIPECDALLIAGDICPGGNAHKQLHWLDTYYRPWLENLGIPIFACAGNHDWPMYEIPHDVEDLKLPWTYLEDESAEFEGLKIYGTPWQKRFYDWAFNLDELQLAGKWNMIPEDTDILITHGPPKYYGDLVQRGTHEGSEVKPKLVVFGHIHPGRGRWQYGDTILANVTIVDNKYNMVYEPMVFEVGIG